MPPKGKKKGKGKKGKKSGVAKPEAGVPTDREELLQKELDVLNAELDGLKEGCTELRNQNEFLQQEAGKIRTESHEYMSYMEKKTHKRQTTIVTLSDQNAKEIQDIKDQKERMLASYEEKKAKLRAIMLEKEAALAKVKQELDDLAEYKNLQSQQLSRINELEKEVTEMRSLHTNAIQDLKSKFLAEKKSYQNESDSKINTMTRLANTEAMRCLNEHTTRIKLENRKLRHTLLNLIRKSRALNEQKLELEEQRKTLHREKQYAEDLKIIRSTRQHKVYNALGIETGAKADEVDESDNETN